MSDTKGTVLFSPEEFDTVFEKPIISVNSTCPIILTQINLGIINS